jgi:hypothetical protein
MGSKSHALLGAKALNRLRDSGVVRLGLSDIPRAMIADPKRGTLSRMTDCMVKNQNEQIRDCRREHDGYLKGTAKPARLGKLKLSTSEELFCSMPSREPGQEALSRAGC